MKSMRSRSFEAYFNHKRGCVVVVTLEALMQRDHMRRAGLQGMHGKFDGAVSRRAAVPSLVGHRAGQQSPGDGIDDRPLVLKPRRAGDVVGGLLGRAGLGVARQRCKNRGQEEVQHPSKLAPRRGERLGQQEQEAGADQGHVPGKIDVEPPPR